MGSDDLYRIFIAILDELKEGSREITDECILKLGYLFSSNVLLAALDLIDRDCVVCFRLPWGTSFFEVHGTTATYNVQLDLPPRMPVFCNCPAFAFSVMLSEDHLLCKHVLAVMLAKRLGLCVERSITFEDVSSRVALVAQD